MPRMVYSRSKNLTEGKFTVPPDELEPKPKVQPRVPPQLQPQAPAQLQPSPTRQPTVKFVLPEPESPRKKRRRNANLYDAVAARVGPHGFHKSKPTASRYRDTASSGGRTLAPEEVLIRRPHYLNDKLKGEPYFAHERLRPDQELPNSDLLTAVHAYVSDSYSHYYERTKRDWESLDESALIAFGYLIEELGREVIGSTGDLPLLEGRGADDDRFEPRDGLTLWHRAHKRRRTDTLNPENYDIVISSLGPRFIRKRRRREKVTTDTESNPPKPPGPPRRKPKKRRRGWRRPKRRDSSVGTHHELPH